MLLYKINQICLKTKFSCSVLHLNSIFLLLIINKLLTFRNTFSYQIIIMSEKKESFINVSYCCVNFINVRFKRCIPISTKWNCIFQVFLKNTLIVLINFVFKCWTFFFITLCLNNSIYYQDISRLFFYCLT